MEERYCEISKKFEFSASHQLNHLPIDHPCSKLHGHNYAVEMSIYGSVDEQTGFVIDYRNLSFLKEWIDLTLDHKHLNDVMNEYPTAENIVHYIYHNSGLENLFIHNKNIISICVFVSETPKTKAHSYFLRKYK